MRPYLDKHGEKVWYCPECEGIFSQPVWHCRNCDHHYHVNDDECHNCYTSRRARRINGVVATLVQMKHKGIIEKFRRTLEA
jgi:hypothetical protein